MPSHLLTPADELRWIVHSYDQLQQVRRATGERIVAAALTIASTGPKQPPADILRELQRSDVQGPVPVLGRLYQLLWEQENALSFAVERRIETHPAWAWLGRVRGVGPTVGARLLARLDVRSAGRPVAFWERCGLATVSAAEYRCRTCGLKSVVPAGQRVSGKHAPPGARSVCAGSLEPVGTSARVVQPRSDPTSGCRYDVQAKRLCYVIGQSLLRAGGKYAEYYRLEAERLDRDRPFWRPERKELAGMRKMEKLFLTHLWITWRQAESLKVGAPSPNREAMQIPAPGPWEMVDT
jgi:hypothetical protein